MKRPDKDIENMNGHVYYHVVYLYITELEAEIQRYKQAPKVPFIKGGTCNTTHYACDCMINRITELEQQLERAEKFRCEEEQKLRDGYHRRFIELRQQLAESVPFEVLQENCIHRGYLNNGCLNPDSKNRLCTTIKNCPLPQKGE